MRYILAILVSAAWVSAVAGGEVRTWTARDGKKMEGELVRRDGTDVILAREGREHRVSMSRLSDEDVQFIEQWSATKREEADDPFTQAPSEAGSGASKTTKKKETPKKYELRNWKDIQGNKVSAKFLRMAGLNVVLEKPGGRLLTVPEATLSYEDRNYVREQLGLPPLPEPSAVAANNGAGGGAGFPNNNPFTNPPVTNALAGAGGGTTMPAGSGTNPMPPATTTAGGGSSYTPPAAAASSSPYGASPPMPTTTPNTSSTTTSSTAGNFNPVTTTTQPAYTTPAQTPTYTPPTQTTFTPPQFQQPTFPSVQTPTPTFQEYFECSRCRARFTMSEVQGKASCPECRCVWNNASQVTGATAYEQGRAVGFIVGPLIVIGIIVAVAKKLVSG